MKILGLHFGHDAGATVIIDGKVRSYILRERHSRIKHAMTLDMSTISMALETAGVTLADVDACAITSTQRKELIIDDTSRLKIHFESHPDHKALPLPQIFASEGRQVEELLNHDLGNYLFKGDPAVLGARIYALLYPEYKGRQDQVLAATGWLDTYINHLLWADGKTLADIAATDYSDILDSEELRKGFYYPVVAEIDGCRLPAYFVDHHLSHAASVYYLSGYDQAGIITHDGHTRPVSYGCGMFYVGQGAALRPLAPHHLFLGGVYDKMGIHLDLGLVGAAGKLMGLAAWGKPSFFDPSFVGNWYDYRAQRNKDGLNLGGDWIEHCLTQAKSQGYDLAPLADRARMTAAINADMAASTQLLFEETLVATARALFSALKKSGVSTRNLCMSGGTALNCPANSRVWRETEFNNVFIEPGCDDGGLAIGAALAVYHNVLEQPLPADHGPGYPSPYFGRPISATDVLASLEQFADKVQWEKPADPAAEMARHLADNKILCWFEGQSEIGPRALGHRSIISDPRDARNWERVNDVKGRERWRPFAPAVLVEHADQYFSGAPVPSPYMLFTATVTSPDLPAITHKDGSSRIQTVDESAGLFCQLLRQFNALTGIPVVMNTSFNGPGEPVVESPYDALRFFANSEVDLMWLDGYKVWRR